MDSGEEEPAGTVSDVEFAPDLSPESDSSSDSDAGDGDPPRNPATQRGIGRARGRGRGQRRWTTGKKKNTSDRRRLDARGDA